VSLLESFIQSYKDAYLNKTIVFDETLLGDLKKAEHLLLDDRLSPSVQLKQALDKLKIRVKEPMKVAITGQFSSGKSTFLNALLAKKILPTGITPVTSKVNYIKYADELQIRVKYKDGRDEYHDIDNIQRFTDQRQSVEDIDYLTLYSPLNMLKDIVFVDTPGLNSGANVDTQTTIKVLQEVDGIIWLTLIDNAGKMSETRVLEKYLSKYKNKSLCVLNQKDKFSEDEVQQSVEYVKKTFAQYFSKVVPISAKQALKSRSSDKNALMQEALDEFIKSLHVKLKADMYENNIDSIEKKYTEYERKLDEIRDMDLSSNIELAKTSNINQVIDFIKEEIQPKAIESKEFAIKLEIQSICEEIIKQYEIFLNIYDELNSELQVFHQNSKEEFKNAKTEFSQNLKNVYIKITQIIDVIAGEIYTQIKPKKRTRYQKQTKGIFSKSEFFVKIQYESAYINADEAYKRLFYDDDLVGKMFKKYIKYISSIEEEVHQRNEEIYKRFEEKIYRWQSPYSIIRKKEKIHSDIEFANMRKFAARVYEHVLKPYNDEMLQSFAHISSGFKHIGSAIEFNYQNATNACVSFLDENIESSVELYEQNPTRFSPYQPSLEDIKRRLEENFFIYKLENIMNKNRTFLSQEYDRLEEKFSNIFEEKKSFVNKQKNRHSKIIELLKSCEKDLKD
jgi:small GTP-binding protein